MMKVAILALVVAVASASLVPDLTSAEDAQCCETCTGKTQKYYSVDKLFHRCGECCMDPSKYAIYKIFEPGLTKATTNSPCAALRYTKYDRTDTHGFGPVKMTIDFYAQEKAVAKRRSEVWTREQEIAAGIKLNSENQSPAPADLLSDEAIPAALNWCDKDGVNYCTMNRNQHIPQYCGSCWAHGAVSALGDRVKIARGGKGVDINLSVQHILNCGNVGSCYGGSIAGAYQFIHQISKTGNGIVFETANPYIACSSDSSEGFCGSVDTTCSAMNTARTCSTFTENGGKCVPLKKYPNVTVSEYGTISGQSAMQKEILARGPIACGIDASQILEYQGGVATGEGGEVDHVISVTGWGTTAAGQGYWIIRNSWGTYWGEMGYIRVAFGALSVEDSCSWAVPDVYTTTNFPCFEGGENCQA